jgi:hypothetical protein
MSEEEKPTDMRQVILIAIIITSLVILGTVMGW